MKCGFTEKINADKIIPFVKKGNENTTLPEKASKGAFPLVLGRVVRFQYMD